MPQLWRGREACDLSGEYGHVDNFRWSESLAVHPSQVADGSAFKMHPGATIDPKTGKIGIHNRKEKLQRIAEHNKMMGTNLHELD